MPVRLRLKRQGRSKRVHFGIVAADSRAPRDGKYIQKLGYYNPSVHPSELYVNQEAVLDWLSKGAQPSDTVRNLLRHSGIMLRYALLKQGKSEEEQERIFDRWWQENGAKKQKNYKFINLEDLQSSSSAGEVGNALLTTHSDEAVEAFRDGNMEAMEDAIEQDNQDLQDEAGTDESAQEDKPKAEAETEAKAEEEATVEVEAEAKPETEAKAEEEAASEEEKKDA